jgi:hypothetical protein
MSVTERDRLHAETLADRAVQRVKDSGGPLTADTVMEAFMALARTPEYDSELLRAVEYDPDDGTEWAQCAGRRLTDLLASESLTSEPLAEHVNSTTTETSTMEPVAEPQPVERHATEPKPHSRRRSR